MKLNELKLTENRIYTSEKDIRQWYASTLSGATLTSITDGKINLESPDSCSFYLDQSSYPVGHKIERLPVQFGKVNGRFRLEGTGMYNLEGCPEYIGQDFSLVRLSKLYGIQGFPKHILRDVIFQQCGDQLSLVGIGEMDIEINGSILFNDTAVVEGGLGLILIKGLRSIQNWDDNPALEIISKYLGKPDLIFDCQQELIEAGYEEFAIL